MTSELRELVSSPACGCLSTRYVDFLGKRSDSRWATAKPTTPPPTTRKSTTASGLLYLKYPVEFSAATSPRTLVAAMKALVLELAPKARAAPENDFWHTDRLDIFSPSNLIRIKFTTLISRTPTQRSLVADRKQNKMAAVFPRAAESSLEEKIAALQSTPLFMKSLPSEESNDPVIQALQSLAFDGTPDEIAQNFKEQGNDYFKGKRHREAISFYTQGIDAKPSDIVLHEALLCNRAACNLELKNYGSVLRDCSKALILNTKSSKAYYRSAMALFALERYEESLDCCERCLEYDPENKGIRSVRDRSAKAKAEKLRKESEKQERIHNEQREKKLLQVAFKERNLFAVYNQKGLSENPYTPHFDPEDPEGTTLIIPVFFLYPQYATSDVIAHFVEDTTFSTHIFQMFPPHAPAPSWDKAGKYNANTLVVYAITRRKRLLKVGKKMSLRDVCNAAKAKEGEPDDGLELKDGCLTFVVVPKGEVEQNWVDEFKRTRDS